MSCLLLSLPFLFCTNPILSLSMLHNTFPVHIPQCDPLLFHSGSSPFYTVQLSSISAKYISTMFISLSELYIADQFRLYLHYTSHFRIMLILHFPYPSRIVSSLAYTLPFHYLSFRVRSVLILALPCHLQSILVNSSSTPDRSYPYLFQTYPYLYNTHPVLSNAVQDPASRHESVSATVLPCHYHTSSIQHISVPDQFLASSI